LFSFCIFRIKLVLFEETCYIINVTLLNQSLLYFETGKLHPNAVCQIAQSSKSDGRNFKSCLG
jgi:hypothetical protein